MNMGAISWLSRYAMVQIGKYAACWTPDDELPYSCAAPHMSTASIGWCPVLSNNRFNAVYQATLQRF